MRTLVGSVFVLAVLAAAGCAGKRGTPGPAEGARPAHPSVDAAADCATCHEQATPAVVADWKQGPHGLALVKCFVCHGSSGADFAARPAGARCDGCHPGESSSVAATGAACSSCHAPHTLAARASASPHARSVTP